MPKYNPIDMIKQILPHLDPRRYRESFRNRGDAYTNALKEAERYTYSELEEQVKFYSTFRGRLAAGTLPGSMGRSEALKKLLNEGYQDRIG